MTFIDLPIDGEVQFSRAPTEQRPDEDLENALRTVLLFDVVDAIRWRQYTPYFNDGDPCVFHTHGVDWKFVGVDEEAGDYDDGFVEGYDPAYQEIVGKYEYVPKVGRVAVDPPNPALTEAVYAAEKAIEGGAHDILLLKTFGDHAEIIATREKFSVDFYEHD